MLWKLIQKYKYRKQLRELRNGVSYTLACDDDILNSDTKQKLQEIQQELKQFSAHPDLNDRDAVQGCLVSLLRIRHSLRGPESLRTVHGTAHPRHDARSGIRSKSAGTSGRSGSHAVPDAHQTHFLHGFRFSDRQ